VAERTRLARLAGSLAALVLVAGCGGTSPGTVSGVHYHDSDKMNGIVLPTAYHVPDVTLTDIHGQPFDLRTDTTKPVTLVFFGYTNCPDVCQVVMADIASAVARLDAADRSHVGVLFVTTDPARDTATVLRSYVARFNPDFGGLTGKLSSIVKAGDALGITIQKGQRLPTGGYDVTHSTQVIGLEPGGIAPIVWTQGTTPGRIAADLHVLLHGGIPGRNA
jgi:protein SCO1/2